MKALTGSHTVDMGPNKYKRAVLETNPHVNSSCKGSFFPCITSPVALQTDMLCEGVYLEKQAVEISVVICVCGKNGLSLQPGVSFKQGVFYVCKSSLLGRSRSFSGFS